MSVAVMIFILLIVVVSVGGWYMLEMMKIRHGYPTSDQLGRLIEPADTERARLLEAENAALKDQLAAVHDRLETLERIVTDKPSRLAAEIDALKSLTDKRAIERDEA